MTAVVLAAAILSALLHASWNLVARQNSTPGDALGGIAIATATVCAGVSPVIGLAPASAWPWIVAASICNVLYLRLLGAAYEHPNFCAVYAVVRTIVPAILFASGWLIWNEPIGPGATLGLAVIAISMVLFSLPLKEAGLLDRATLAHSIMAGGVLALGLLLDIRGIRVSDSGIDGLIRYTVSSSLTTASGVAVLALIRGKNPVAILLNHGRPCYTGALLLLASYLCGMWAYAKGPIGLVAPVRESSILFGGLLAVMVLRQRVSIAQWTAMVLATVGIVLVQAG